MQFTTPSTSSVKPPIQAQSARVQLLSNVGKWRWLLGVVALGLALYAGQLVEQARALGSGGAPPSASWLLFALAALVFVAGVWPVPRLLPSQPPLFWGTWRTRQRRSRRLFIALLILSFAFSIAAVPLFINLNTNPDPLAEPQGWLANTGSWLLYITSLLLFGLAFIVWERIAPPTQDSAQTPVPGGLLPRRIEWLLIAALSGAALLIRFYSLDNLPVGLWFDEAQNGVVARRLVEPNTANVTYIGDAFTQMGMLDLYFTGTLIRIFGNEIWIVRLLPALCGSLSIPLLYLLASRLYGWRVGLAAAGLLAVSAWHITFSRFASGPLIVTTAIDLAAYVCIAQALRTGRLGYYAGAGILLGLGLHGYYPAKFAFFVLFAVLVHKLITERMRVMRAVRAGITVFVVGVLLAFMPVGLFAAQHWDVYNSRVNTVSIFSPAGNEGRADAFNESVRLHLLMFNWQGDRNGRHNLPGQPMLDWTFSALFFAGLGTCILRAWRWQYFFPVVWFVASMLGGVLSLLWEAPQGARTVETSVVTALLAGIFLGELVQLVSRAFHPESHINLKPMGSSAEGDKSSSYPRTSWFPLTPRLRRRGGATASVPSHVSTLPVRVRAASKNITSPIHQVGEGKRADITANSSALSHAPAVSAQPRVTSRSRREISAWVMSALGLVAIIAWIGSTNIHRYFEVQAKDNGVWQEMYSAEAEAARMALRYNSTHDLWASPLFVGLPTVSYLAPGLTLPQWPGMHSLPLSMGARDTILMLDPSSAADLSSIADLYPHATFELMRPPKPDSLILMYKITIPAADIRDLYGVRATVYDTGATEAREEKTIPDMSFDWKDTLSGTLRLATTLKVDRYGTYTFDWQSAEGDKTVSNLLIDGFTVASGTPISLSVGLHSIVATDTVKTAQRSSQLLWKPSEVGETDAVIPPGYLLDPRKVEPHGLMGLFRSGVAFDGPVQESRVDPVISFYFHNTIMPRPYSAEWKGKLYIPEAGTYAFATEQLSQSQLFIDGNELIVNMAPNVTMEQQVSLTAGWHDIRLLFQDLSGFSHMYLYWTPPGRERAIIPSLFLRPQMSQYVAQPESKPLPTLDQANGARIPEDRIIEGSQYGASTPQSPPGEQLQQPAVAGEPITPLIEFGRTGEALLGPFSVATDDNENIYIFTHTDGKIHKYDKTGKPLLSWAIQNAKGSPVVEGSAMLVKGERLFLLDADTLESNAYDLDGKYLERFQICKCYYPRGLTSSRDGNLWVADTGNARIMKVAPGGGEPLATFGERGSGPGQFIEPTSVWESPQGTLFVADVGNSRVQTFGPDLKPLNMWSMGESLARDGNRLVGTDDGNVLVTQFEDKVVVLYDPTGKELGRWTYTRDGTVLAPAGIAQAGVGSYVVLYPKENLGIVFKP